MSVSTMKALPLYAMFRLTVCVVLPYIFTTGIVQAFESVNIPEGEGMFRSRVCGEVDTVSTVELSCPSNTWFHVLHKLSSLESVDNCSALTLPGTNTLIEGSVHRPPLTPECRGRQTVDSSSQLCNETIQVPLTYNASEVMLFQVKYECINENLVYNMCDDVSEEITGDVYLASPSFYPSATAASSDVICSCRLTTMDSFTAQALYLTQRDVWNMTCETCSITVQNQYVDYPVVNKDLFQDTTQNQAYELYIELRPISQSSTVDNELWIRFKGGSTVHLQCNGGLDIISTQAATVTTTGSSATTYTSTDTDTTTTEQPPSSTSTPTTTTSSSTGVSAAETPDAKQTTNTETSSSSLATSTATTTTSSSTGSVISESAPVSSTETRQTTNTEASSSSGDLEEGVLIVIGFLSGAVFVLLLVATLYLCRRYRQSKMAPAQDESNTEPNITNNTDANFKHSDYEVTEVDPPEDDISLTEVPNLYSSLQPVEERNRDNTNMAYTPFRFQHGNDPEHNDPYVL